MPYKDKDKEKAYNKAYREANKEILREKQKASYQKNKDKRSEKHKLHYRDNKEKILQQTKAYYLNNREERLKKQKEWTEANKDKVSLNGKIYRELNKEKIQAYRRSDEQKQKNLKRSRDNEPYRWFKVLYNRSKTSMKHRFKTEIDFDADYILELFHKQEGLCGYFKIPMIPSGKRTHPFRPSLDRIDNDKGYLKDNIVLCTIMANLGRQSCPYDEWMKCLDGLEIKKKCSM
jgi:hypothetical protein